MVKGISRQVILVNSPDPRLFEQAIFILKEEALGEGVTDDQLLKEAQRVIREGGKQRRRRPVYLYGGAWALGGALVTGLLWLATVLL